MQFLAHLSQPSLRSTSTSSTLDWWSVSPVSCVQAKAIHVVLLTPRRENVGMAPCLALSHLFFGVSCANWACLPFHPLISMLPRKNAIWVALRLHFRRTPNSDSFAYSRRFFSNLGLQTSTPATCGYSFLARSLSVIHQPCPSVLTPNGFVKHEAPKTWMSKHEDLSINQLDGNLRHLPRLKAVPPQSPAALIPSQGEAATKIALPGWCGRWIKPGRPWPILGPSRLILDGNICGTPNLLGIKTSSCGIIPISTRLKKRQFS